jgi:hypothetical protein
MRLEVGGTGDVFHVKLLAVAGALDRYRHRSWLGRENRD